MIIKDLLPGSLAYWRQPGLPNAIDQFVAWLERCGSLGRVRKFEEFKNKQSAYLLSQFISGKMSKGEVIRYCLAERLNWALKETEDLARSQVREIKKNNVGFFDANAARGSHNEFTVAQMVEKIKNAM